MNIESIAAALGRYAPKAGGGYMACCPAHPDKNPSLAIDENGGSLLVKCFAGCDQGAVIDALKALDLWPGNGETLPPTRKPSAPTWCPVLPVPAAAPAPPAVHPRHGKPSTTWAYRNEGGELLGMVYRFDKPGDVAPGGKPSKEILPLTYCTDGKAPAWRWQAFPEPRPLNGLDLLGDATHVLIVEGEKAADAARRLLGGRLPVVTWPGGSNAVAKADWRPLSGISVAIWPDADLPGIKAAVAVAEELEKVGAASVKIVEPPEGAPEGWDLADAEVAGWTTAILREWLKAGLKPEEFRIKHSPSAPGKSPGVILHRASDVAIQPVQWLWPHWVARGKLHIIAGQAGTGKTSLILALLANLTNGHRWPDGASGSDPAHVLIWSAEDSASDTIVPRLMAAGADLDRVHIISGVNAGETKRTFDPSADLDQLLPAIRELRPAAIMVDPIVSAVAGDSHKNAETRRSLQPLVDLAEQFNLAVIGISHFSKGTTGREPLERVTGSLAFAALARVVLAAAKLPADNPHGAERILARAKSNIGPDEGAIGYKLAVVEVAPGVEVARVEWQNAIDGSARELLAEPEQEEGGALGEARAFLEDFLANGPKPVTEILSAAKRAGVAERTLKRAKSVIGATATKSGLHAGWQWSLPPTMPSPPEECHHKSLASFEQFEECQQVEVAPLATSGPLHSVSGEDNLPAFEF